MRNHVFGRMDRGQERSLQDSGTTGRKFIATPSHTAIILLILVALAIEALVQMVRVPHDFVGSSGRLLLYGQIVTIQLLLLWFVRAGIRRSGYSVRALVDESPWNVGRWTRYLGLGIAAWLLWMIFSGALSFFATPTPEELQAVLKFLPRGPIEKSCWILFALITNFCEEVLYRGYLMRQFRSFTGSTTLALLLQAVVFGLGHVSLGMALMLSVSLLALFLGALALWQKSLIPGMIAHISLSVFGGLLSST
jgi:uncharacterized protein